MGRAWGAASGFGVYSIKVKIQMDIANIPC